MPLYYSIFRYFCSKNIRSLNFHHLSTFRYLFHIKFIIIVFYATLQISFNFGLKQHYCYAHADVTSMSFVFHLFIPLIISKQDFLLEAKITQITPWGL